MLKENKGMNDYFLFSDCCSFYLHFFKVFKFQKSLPVWMRERLLLANSKNLERNILSNSEFHCNL